LQPLRRSVRCRPFRGGRLRGIFETGVPFGIEVFAMYLLFLDESGTPPTPAKGKDRYLVIAGVIIPEGAWHAIAKEFGEIRRDYKIKGEIKWKFFGKSNNDKNSSIQHLPNQNKEDLRTDLFRILTKRRSVKIIACVTSVEAAYARPTIIDQDDVYHLTYKAVTERFQYFLQDASRVTSQNQFGLVICDHRMSGDDKKLRKRHNELLERRSDFTSSYDNLIETIFFSPSDVSVGLQLADMAAGAIHRSFQYGEHRFANAITKSFRTSKSGVILGYGLVKMPKGDFIEPSKGSFI
jgi:hypothetical protein